MECVSSTDILIMQGQSGRSIHKGGGTLQDYKIDWQKPILNVCREAGPSQTSGILKYIVFEAIYRVKESLDRHLSEGAVSGCDGGQTVSAMTAERKTVGPVVGEAAAGQKEENVLNTKGSTLYTIVKENQIISEIRSFKSEKN